MKLRICFLWHMHQPYYKDPESGTYILPWVRLHAIKDYVALPRIFSEFPRIKHTFNLVPSLLIQVRDYVENGAEDRFLTISRKNALDFSRLEEEFVIRNFFSAFPATMIFPQPRYAELFHRKDEAFSAIGRPGIPGGFGASDYTDLVSLFNLTWFHPIHREEDPELERLWRKGRDFTEKEKHYILDQQIEVMRQLIPEYRKYALETGGELSSTPMYHPILPLLIDNDSAQDAVPDAPLPRIPFAYPEDARIQLERGREVFRDMFGVYPQGVWPSEGSISPATVAMAAGCGFRWGATDELLLARSLGKVVKRDADGIPTDPSWLYRPYQAVTPEGNIAFFFRDHHLSDLIGFEYSRWDATDAANNFVNKIKKIYERLSTDGHASEGREYVIPVILDGENAWEYFYDSGRLFLKTLMGKLDGLYPNIECVTLSSALDCCSKLETLPRIPTGSWIDGTFYIWIGHEEDLSAWDMLAKARSTFESRRKKSAGDAAFDAALSSAHEHLLVAEGSDWCWWYGDDHFTPHGPEFDSLFRNHIKAAYKDMGEIPPDSVDIPILKKAKMPSGKNIIGTPRSFIQPKINGLASSYFDWSAATKYVPMPEFGSMHRAGFGLLTAMHYGFSQDTLYLKADLHEGMIERRESFLVEFLFPKKEKKVSVRLNGETGAVATSLETMADSSGGGSSPGQGAAPAGQSGESLKAAFVKVLELGIPFSSLGCAAEDQIEFFVTIQAGGNVGERWPMYGNFTAELPGQDFEQRMWEI